MKECKYTYNNLQKFCIENNVQIFKDYSNEVIKRETKIEGKCKKDNCNGTFNKSFRELIENKSYFCKLCLNKISNIKRKNTCLEKYNVDSVLKNICRTSTKYNYELLEIFLQDNNIKINKNYKNEHLHANYKLEFLCSNNTCNQLITREFCKVINMRTLCVNCSRINAKEIRKQTNIQKIGFENNFQSNEIKEKIKQTNLQKYGVEYCIQNADIAKKVLSSGLKFKDYVFPSGKIVKIQGYEDTALDELIINEKIDESNIIIGVKNVPTIWYQTNDGIKHRHYVDIFIPTQNRCIEVKGEWFYKRDKVKLELKKQAAEKIGYKYELWVYDRKRKRIFCEDNISK
jgi:hypothetical protein